MAHGVSSSQRIERLCGPDVAFRVICAQDTPDHTVLARFRKDHQEALGGLLTESLVLAAELGMVSLGVVALDGTKISGNASRDANRGAEHLRRRAEGYLQRVQDTDAAEDALFGADARGEQSPDGAADRTGRCQRIDAALAQIAERRAQAGKADREQAQRAAVCEEAVAAGSKGRGRYPAGIDRVEMARIRWQRAREEAAAHYEKRQRAHEQGEPVRGRPPVPPQESYPVRAAGEVYQAETAAAAGTGEPPDARTEGVEGTTDGRAGATGDAAAKPQRVVANLTDPESRLLKTGTVGSRATTARPRPAATVSS